MLKTMDFNKFLKPLFDIADGKTVLKKIFHF